MQPFRLKAEIIVLTVLIKHMDNLHDLGMKESISLEELQSIYSRIKVLKLARGILLKKRRQVSQEVSNGFAYKYLIQLAKERMMN